MNALLIHKGVWRLTLYVYLAGILLAALVPLGGLNIKLQSINVLNLRLDYLIHALVFLPLVPLWRLVWPHHHPWQVFLPGMVIAASAEAVQYALPYRAFNINDLIANVLGVIVGALFTWLFIKLAVPKK